MTTLAAHLAVCRACWDAWVERGHGARLDTTMRVRSSNLAELRRQGNNARQQRYYERKRAQREAIVDERQQQV